MEGLADIRSYLRALRPSTLPTQSPNEDEPCEACRPSWGYVGNNFCDCAYGAALQRATEKGLEDEERNHLKQLREGALIPPRFADAHAVDFLGTALLHKATEVAKTWLTGEPRGLYLWGPVGTGKSHLAAGMLNWATEKGKSGRWLVVPDWLESIRDSFNTPGRPQELMEGAKNTKVLVLDDLGAEKPSEWVREQLYRLVNGRYLERKAVVATSNLSLAEAGERIGDRTCSRLVEMCEVLHVGGKDRRLAR